MDLILLAVISLGAIGLIAAVILFVASKKFAVYEDPEIVKAAVAELAKKDEKDELLEKKNKELRSKSKKKKDDFDDDDDDLD